MITETAPPMKYAHSSGYRQGVQVWPSVHLRFAKDRQRRESFTGLLY
jgi:hypothetical protein